MSDAPAPAPAALPRWLPWVFLGLLVLPFHPLWVDFEQVRRGFLLIGGGAVILFVRRLPPVRGERALWWLLGFLLASAAVNFAGQLLAQSETQPLSFQPWEAAYRLAHWLALVAVLRLGALAPRGFATPLATILLAAATFGLLQHLGLLAIGSYGTAREPVSVFGNLNVASEWTAIAAAAIAAIGTRPLWLAHAALATAGAYLVVNGSRSGLVALPIGLLLLGVVQRRERPPRSGWLPLAVALGGAAIGAVLLLAAPRPEPTDLSAATAETKRGTVTLGVRLEIAKGSTKLFGESPLFGHGPGQFPIQYPRVRSQDEIEASSHGRQFASEVRTAHDDWIEILVEGGLPGLVLFAFVLFALQRGATDRARQLPLFVLLLLMLVRSPLGNAPAVATALLFVASAGPAVVATRRRLWAERAAGVVLLGLGILPVLGNSLAAPYLAARASGDHPPREAIESASFWMPFEPRWLQLLAQEQMVDGNLQAAAATASRALKLRPFDPQLYLLLGEVLARSGRNQDAQLLAEHALRFDPANPELRVLLSTVMAQRRAHDEAVAAVVQKPHPVLRAQLGQHFRALSQLAGKNGDADGAARFAVEHHFLAAVETLGDSSIAARTTTLEHVRGMLQSMRDAAMLRTDLRGHALGSLQALDLGDPQTAIDQGTVAGKLGIPMPQWQKDLFGAKLEPLQSVESWRTVLERR